jgi:hypothetical protein
MDHNIIVQFFSGVLTPEDLGATMYAEVSYFRATVRETARGNILVSSGPRFIINRDGARRLLEAVANDRLPFDAANYLVDCIIMNDDFDFADEAVCDAILFLENDIGRVTSRDEKWRPTLASTLRVLASLD